MMDTRWVDGGEPTRKTRDPSTLHISHSDPFQGTRSPAVSLWMCKPNVGVSRCVVLDNIVVKLFRGCWSRSPMSGLGRVHNGSIACATGLQSQLQ